MDYTKDLNHSERTETTRKKEAEKETGQLPNYFTADPNKDFR